MNATGEGSIPEKRVNIATIIIHENFDHYTKMEDIALLELAEEVGPDNLHPGLHGAGKQHRSFVDPDLFKQ